MNASKPIVSVKNFVVRNQTKILITTTVAATVSAGMFKIAVSQRDEFLKENNLYDAFWAQTDDEN